MDGTLFMNLDESGTTPGKAKIVLSTNIAESSITIPDVRYVLDFGVVRKLMLDDERSMLTLVNSWASKATCVQRRGRCRRLHEATILYLFSRESVFERMREYAEPEVMNVPLEMIYLKSKVGAHRGTREMGVGGWSARGIGGDYCWHFQT